MRTLKVGDPVFWTGDSGLYDPSISHIEKIKTVYDHDTGKPSLEYTITGGYRFDADGVALNSPLSYYIEPYFMDQSGR